MKRHSPFPIAMVLVISWATLAAAQTAPVSVNWLDGAAPAVAGGVSWGVPWPRGTVKKDQSFTLKSATGKALPLQSWPLAYWPDGSIKWTGLATVGGPDTVGPLNLSVAATAQPAGAVVKVRATESAYEIDTGPLKCRIAKWGSGIIDSMVVNGHEVARQGQLVCILQNGPDGNPDEAPPREKFMGKVNTVTVEQSGPVRAVLKLEGIHRSIKTDRQWLPFVVRLYFYAGQESVRMVHTIVYDGDEQKDFIRGLGVTFAVPMREEMQNRHVRFSGQDGGLWAEPIQPMKGRNGRFIALPPTTQQDIYPDQVQGKAVPNKDQVPERSQTLMDDWAIWDGFKLDQLSADGFTIVKRTNPESCWLPAGMGQRASGLVFVGDTSGGLGVSLKNFWQMFPTALEVQKASTPSAELTVWMWSPDAPSMDLRHYDIKAHGLDSVYEDVQPGFSTPYGVARTNELMLYPSADVPTKEETVAMAQASEKPPMLVSTPKYLHDVGVFGIWSLPDRSTALKRAVEDQLDANIAFYQKAVDQWNWYGFWDFGDVMHTYDSVRHVWRYDMGGYAWDNTELGTDMWLWYSYLRNGKADIYRMAEAMTRSTSEVSCYHLGKFAGFGSRHNVRHWGCGAKEARISQAEYRRFYYYLSTDERTGDIMREMLNADFKAADFDPMRLAMPITEKEKQYPARVRVGPDWFAFVGNWMTEWERTGDTKWRDKIMAGVESIAGMKYGLRSGTNMVMGYDPKTGKLFQVSDELGNYNLPTIMGGAEVMFEMNQLIDNPAWQKAWLQYCRIAWAPKDVVDKDLQTGKEGEDGSYVREDTGNVYGVGRLAGYAYMKTKLPGFAEMAGKQLGNIRLTVPPLKKFEGPDVLNPIEESYDVSTNNVTQYSLTAIEVLELCADHLPERLGPPATQPATNSPSPPTDVRTPRTEQRQ